ncbi:hypothetical protein RRG08_014645 [Elysia crispata]|uniref:Uncharacterized protein n=1 Tax=Elysia crispata TaxID=231223 RepID=A0AAE0YHK3_9GAST|nr:hypothetical protein RRG08_014645 [Elysia crispata]
MIWYRKENQSFLKTGYGPADTGLARKDRRCVPRDWSLTGSPIDPGLSEPSGQGGREQRAVEADASANLKFLERDSTPAELEVNGSSSRFTHRRKSPIDLIQLNSEGEEEVERTAILGASRTP